MSSLGDYLLYAVSAREQISWAGFKKLFDTLLEGSERPWQNKFYGFCSPAQQRIITAKAFDSLAHWDLEFERSGGRVFIAPPVIVRLPWAGLPEAVLVGRRSPESLFYLTEACRGINQSIEVMLEPQQLPIAWAPQRISIKAESVKELELVADKLGIACISEPSAWKLLHFSGDLDAYLSDCSWEVADELQWQRQAFAPEQLRFRFGFSIENQAGYRLMRYTDPVRGTPIHLLWDGGKRAKVDVDWGRYAVFKDMGLNLLVYDERRFILAEPIGAPIPRLLRRALTLCSGYFPKFVLNRETNSNSTGSWGANLFQDIPLGIGKLVADKLGQQLKFSHISLEKGITADG